MRSPKAAAAAAAEWDADAWVWGRGRGGRAGARGGFVSDHVRRAGGSEDGGGEERDGARDGA